MNTLFIRPLDTQFYRDGRPFDAGTESEGHSLFPPFPRTIYGALRALIMSAAPNYQWGDDHVTDAEFERIVGGKDRFGTLIIRGPVVARVWRELSGATKEHDLWFPVPFDLLNVKNQPDELTLIVPNMAQSSALNDLRQKLYLCKPTQPTYVKGIRGYVDQEQMERYLKGEVPWKFQASDGIERPEPRIGLARNLAVKTAAHGKLYAARHVRMQEASEPSGTLLHHGFLVEAEGVDGLLPPKGVLRLGGDSRPAEFQIVDDHDWTRLKEAARQKILETGRFKAYLITPALFTRKPQWYPDFLDDDSSGLTGILPGTSHPVRLVSACVGRPVPVGGFDIAKGYPKQTWKAVPAGSVYFFKFENWETWDQPTREKAVSSLLNQQFNKPVVQTPVDCQLPQAREGFGVALIGGW